MTDSIVPTNAKIKKYDALGRYAQALALARAGTAETGRPPIPDNPQITVPWFLRETTRDPAPVLPQPPKKGGG